MLLRFYRADRPDTEELPAWLAANTSVFPAPKTEDQKVEAKPETPQATPVTNSGGAPAADPRSSLPTDIFQVDPTAWKVLTPKEKAEYFDSYKRSRGVQGNPFAARKTSPEGSLSKRRRGVTQSRRFFARSQRNLIDALKQQGHQISRRTLAALLKDLGYSLQGNRKKLD